MNSAVSNIDKKSIQTLIDKPNSKRLNNKTPQCFDLFYIRSIYKSTSIVKVDTPVTAETPKKNINITSSKTLTKLDKSIPNCDIVTETPALKVTLVSN